MNKRFTLLLAAWLLMACIPLWGQTRVNVTDVLTRELTGVTGTTYTSWSGVTSNSNAVYAGQSAGGNDVIQLRSNNNNSGIITTASGGTVTSVSVVWNSNTANGRTLNVYGKDSEYTSPTELYNAETQGTLIGTIVNGTSTELVISDNYAFIGLRSSSGAMWLNEIDITWSTGGTQQNVSAPTFSPAGGVYGEPQTVTINCATAGATIYYTTDGSIPTTNSSVYSSPLTISETTTVKAMATKAGMNNSNVATATYTIQEMTNITTIAGLWELATNVGTTATLTSVTFNNWYVTGVRNSQVCVSDGQYGFVIYQSGHGFSAGDKLNGTVTCNALLYQNHYAELTGVHASDLTVVPNQEMPVLSTTINNLVVQNYGTAINLGTLTYNGTAFEDEQGHTIVPYNNFNLSPNPITTLETGTQYNVKGVSIIYWTGDGQTQQIAPRTADDFEPTSTPPQQTVATPVISPEGGQYVNMVEVSITCATEGAVIHYTTDGSTPSSISPVYTQALQIVDDVTVKAIAMKEGYVNSEVASASYSIITPLAVTFSKVTNPIDINTTDSYLLVCESAGTAATATITNSALQAVGVTINAEEHTVSTCVNNGNLPCQIGFEAAEGGYYIAIGEGYLNNGSGTALSISSTPTSVWVLNPHEGGYILQNTSNSNRFLGGTTPEGLAYKAYAITNLGNENYPFVVLYKEGETSPMLSVEAPTITPNGGTYTAAQEVTLACATAGATIYYTLDGTDPTTASTVYSAPFTVSETTTVKAMAAAEGMSNSSITTATFTFPTVITIAEARALENNAYALVEGVVTFQDGRNIYVQDATAGIVLYLNSNTVPSDLALGDQVRAYGKKTVYNGLVELSGINGGDASVFSILSSNNELPFANKTIAEVLAGADGLLQSTRVKISNAVLGAINTASNTVLSQGADSINIYKIPALTGIEENSHVNVTAVVGYFYNPQLRVAYASDVELLPSNITVIPGVLQGFTYEQGEGPSAAQSFTITGEYLASTVVITANEYFEVSDAENGVYANTLTLNTTNGLLAVTPVYVRLMAGLSVGSYNTNLSVVSGDDALTVSLSGSVTISNMVAMPTFSPEGGTYMNEQTVTIECATAGATIHYTLNGTDPTENSPVYAGPITVNTDMTIKAMGVKENWLNSEIASASYVIRTPITIAEARLLENNQYATVAGVVTLIDNRNVYIQDATAGIDLYLNSNTVPENLAVGDLVIAYGKKSVYNGLVELTGINGNNELELMIVLSGNVLPLATKTIAEVLEDYQGSNMLQSTRICIEQAVVESINHNGNSLISQNGSQINIYHLPVVEGLAVGDVITFVGVVGCYNAPQMLIGSADDIIVTHNPSMTATPASLSGFNYIVDNGPSEEQTLTVSGQYLEGEIILTATGDFEISSGTGSSFNPATNITLSPTNGVVNNATIYVRMKSGLAIGAHTGQVNLTSQNAMDVVVNCSGNVHDQGGTTNDWRRISSLSEIVEGGQLIIAARYDNENVNSYYAMTATTSGKPEGVFCETFLSGNDEVLPATITDEADTYAWTIGRLGDAYTFTNASGQVLGYSSSTNFATGGDNIGWTITEGTSIDTGVMVSNYTAFNIINANVTTRAAALNTNHNFGPYSTSNMTNGNGANYNLYLDIFMGTSSSTPTVSAPTFDPDGGTYYEAQEVTISCATADATLYYSTESEEGPWTEYTEPIVVEEDMTLWAYGEKEGYENSMVVSATYVIQDDIVVLFNQDWEGDWNGWTSVSVIGEPQWTIASYSGNHYAYANAYNQGETEDWLISPAFDLDAHPDAVLSFRTAKNYTGPDIEVYFANDYDGQNPGDANWQLIECPLSGGSWSWVSSGDISLSAFSGSNCHISFKYTSTEDQAAGWEVDDILLYTGGTPSNDPYLIANPNTLTGFTHLEDQGPSEPQTFVLSGGNFLPSPPTWGTVTLSLGDLLPTYFEMSLDGENYSTVLTIDLDETLTLEPTTVYVRLNAIEIGEYDATIVILADPDTYIMVTLSGEVLSADQPYIDYAMPMYIQGNNGSNNNRVPVATAMVFGNMNPNTTYRYVNQFVDENDGPETAGAGNVIFANPDGFYRTTSPSLATEGSYGEFTTDEYGEAYVWLINEPTANARFTPGNQVYLRVRLNDGNEGTEVAHIFTTEDYATVLNFGNEYEANQGSAFYVKSNEAPMNFAVLYNDEEDERPVYITCIETTGVDYANINQYAGFYKEEVAGKDGYFGGILPNDGPGINFIQIIDMDFWEVNIYETTDGLWGTAQTANPTVGLDNPIFIDLTDLSVQEGQSLEVKVWNSGHEFMVENNEDSELDMTVVNLLGQPLMRKSIAAGSHVSISHHLAEGLYILTLQNNKGKMSAKVLVR